VVGSGELARYTPSFSRWEVAAEHAGRACKVGEVSLEPTRVRPDAAVGRAEAGRAEDGRLGGDGMGSSGASPVL